MKHLSFQAEHNDIVTINGQDYSGDIFIVWGNTGGPPTEVLFRFTRDANGAIAMSVVDYKDLAEEHRTVMQ